MQKILKLEVSQALYRQDGKWYHNVQKFPGALFDENGYVIFNEENEYLNNPLLQIKKDLHVVGGINNLPTYRNFTNYERLLIYGDNLTNFLNDHKKDDEETVRVLREIQVIQRKGKLVSTLKKMYSDSCQLCGTKVPIKSGKFYSEVHHIIPLGNPHKGKDTLNNMISVCPNHHVQLDLRAIHLNPSQFVLNNHVLSKESLQYHNSLVEEF
ncbi:HNH endonuclease [Autumnicola musiva]|uniref:HNH endonuclease n=1 Tax=Autumnicola musiva TaxID=3075589 RepID=A0ABU3D4K8_9FLAO|nr:HNH endonuclease [Zunongwangia sp. F117]MDT0676468.1 HNH endonuclease [Zunongwangia sp. F117]